MTIPCEIPSEINCEITKYMPLKRLIKRKTSLFEFALLFEDLTSGYTLWHHHLASPLSLHHFPFDDPYFRFSLLPATPYDVIDPLVTSSLAPSGLGLTLGVTSGLGLTLLCDFRFRAHVVVWHVYRVDRQNVNQICPATDAYILLLIRLYTT